MADARIPSELQQIQSRLDRVEALGFGCTNGVESLGIGWANAKKVVSKITGGTDMSPKAVQDHIYNTFNINVNLMDHVVSFTRKGKKMICTYDFVNKKWTVGPEGETPKEFKTFKELDTDIQHWSGMKASAEEVIRCSRAVLQCQRR